MKIGEFKDDDRVKSWQSRLTKAMTKDRKEAQKQEEEEVDAKDVVAGKSLSTNPNYMAVCVEVIKEMKVYLVGLCIRRTHLSRDNENKPIFNLEPVVEKKIILTLSREDYLALESRVNLYVKTEGKTSKTKAEPFSEVSRNTFQQVPCHKLWLHWTRVQRV